MATTTDSNTTINVNPGTPNVPEPPEFRMHTRPRMPEGEPPIEPRTTAETPTSEPVTPRTATSTAGPRVDHYRHEPTPTGNPMGSVNGQKVEINEKPGKVDTHVHHQPNWGRIVKGALVVAAVALVAVVAFTVVPPLVTGAIEALGLGPALSSVYAAVGPALAAAGEVVMSGFAFVSAFLSSALSAIGGALGLTGATTAAGAAAAASTGQVAGYIAAGGAVAAGAPLAAKALMSQPLVDTVHHTVVTPPETTVTGLEDGGANAHASTHTTTVTHHAPGNHSTHSQPAPTMMDMPDLHDDMLQHQQASNMKMASKMTHHAAEHGHEGHTEQGGHAEKHERARSALNNTANRSGEWASRVNAGLTNRDRALLARHESHTSHVDADRATLADSVVR